MIKNKIIILSAFVMMITSYANARDQIKIVGSSTVYPYTTVVAERFGKQGKFKTPVVESTGTGGGFKKFCRGETLISNASRPISKKEMDMCAEAGIAYIELPIAYDALTLVTNKGNDWAKSMTVAELNKIWDSGSSVKNWFLIRISNFYY